MQEPLADSNVFSNERASRRCRSSRPIDGQEEAARQRVMDALGHRGSAQ